MYLVFLGQCPSQTDLSNKCIVTVMMCSSIGLLIPTLLQFYLSICDKNSDAAIETLPHLFAVITAFFNLLCLHLNRENIRKAFITVEKDWKLLEFSREMNILEEITGKGYKIVRLYRDSLLLLLIIFVIVPLFNPMLDIILPLNETRARQQIFNLCYVVDTEEYFYSIYLHLGWCSTVTIVIIITIDSVNMMFTHHASALFAICGYKIQKATECNDVATKGRFSMDDGYQQIRECVVNHKKAIQFFEFLDATNRMNFMLRFGLNIIGISVIAFQIVMHLDDMKQAIRYVIFFGGQKFHLFFLNLPGQILMDYSEEVLHDIYRSKWYHASVKMQRMLKIMQLRACKPCMLTAGGLFEMNIETFGTATKTSMSYFTMLLSTTE